MTLILLLACAGDTITSAIDTQVEADADADADADTDADTDADSDADSDADTDADSDADTDPATASISGEITFSVPIVDDGVGNLYVAVFDKDPVWDSANATAMGQQIISDVDFNVDGPVPTYSISGIEPRSTAYYVLAFFDDNGTASEITPTPDKGDLISFDLNTVGAPQVMINGDTTKDIDLNAEMPW